MSKMNLNEEKQWLVNRIFSRISDSLFRPILCHCLNRLKISIFRFPKNLNSFHREYIWPSDSDLKMSRKGFDHVWDYLPHFSFYQLGLTCGISTMAVNCGLWVLWSVFGFYRPGRYRCSNVLDQQDMVPSIFWNPNPLLRYSTNVKDSENTDRWLAVLSSSIVHKYWIWTMPIWKSRDETGS